MADTANSLPITLPSSTPKTSRALPLVLIMLLISLAISGYLFWQNRQLQQQLTIVSITPNPSPLGSPQPVTETTNPTSGWETYTNISYKYQIKFPQNFSVGDNGMAGSDIQKSTAVIFYNKALYDDYRSPRFSITTRVYPDSFENVVNKHFQKLTTNLMTEVERQTAVENLGITLNPNQATDPLTKITFLDYPAYQFSITGSTVDDRASEHIVESENYKYLWIDTGNGYLLISYSNTDQMNLILSTFKFTE